MGGSKTKKNDKTKTLLKSNQEEKDRSKEEGEEGKAGKKRGWDEIESLFDDKKKKKAEAESEGNLKKKTSKKLKPENNGKLKPKGIGGDWVDDGLGGVYNSEGYTGRVEEGVRVFKGHVLQQRSDAGQSELCPFDCDCCYM